MTYLIDTNVISELRKRERGHPSVRNRAEQVQQDSLYTSVLVIGEIRRGIELKRRSDPAQASALDAWFASVKRRLEQRILTIDEPIVETWGRLSVPDPLPLIDGLLAATAIMHGLILVTRNTRDVARAGVPVLNPFA